MTDLISREAVLKAIDDDWICNAEQDYRGLVEEIKKLPSIQLSSNAENHVQHVESVENTLQDRPKKRGCYFYSEVHDMGASIPCCGLNEGLGNCPCEDCDKFLSRDNAFDIVLNHIKGEDRPKGHWIVDAPQDEITYGIMNKNGHISCLWSKSYAEALDYAKKEQPMNRPYYILKRTEHYEIVGEVKDNAQYCGAKME